MPWSIIVTLLAAAITGVTALGSADIRNQPQMQYNQNMMMLAVLNSRDPVTSLLLLQIMQGNMNITGSNTAGNRMPNTWIGGLPYEPWK